MTHVCKIESPSANILQSRGPYLKILLCGVLSRIAILRTEEEIAASPLRIYIDDRVETVLLSRLGLDEEPRLELLSEDLFRFQRECLLKQFWYCRFSAGCYVRFSCSEEPDRTF